MSYHDDRDTSPHRVPASCSELGNEFEVLNWASKTLALCNRLPSCSRKETLVNALTAMLEDTHLLSYHQLKEDLKQSDFHIRELDKQVELLKAKNRELEDNNPLISELIESKPQLTDEFGNLRFRLISRSLFKVWIWVSVVMGLGSCLFILSRL